MTHLARRTRLARRVLAAAAALVVSCAAVVDARAEVPLRMPWACGAARVMTQGNQLGSHRGKGAYAWDFRMARGERVLAMAPGRVRVVRGDSRQGGCDPKLAEAANYVIITHDDGAEALYLHLEADSLEVVPGQRVVAGEPIGRVGLSGWVCGAHLHVQLQQPCGSWWCASVPSRFVEGALQHGEAIVSQNCAPRETGARRAFAASGAGATPARSVSASAAPHTPAREEVAQCAARGGVAPVRARLLVLCGVCALGWALRRRNIWPLRASE